MTDTAYATRVRELNDAFRKTLTGGTVLLTQGVRELGRDHTRKALAAVKSFDRFEHGNDPHSEHDFGALELDGAHFFFKIDTYDLAMERHSPDATDPRVTARVLTLMLDLEYRPPSSPSGATSVARRAARVDRRPFFIGFGEAASAGTGASSALTSSFMAAANRSSTSTLALKVCRSMPLI